MPSAEHPRGDTSHPIEFVPTPAQWRYLREYLAADGPSSIKEIAARASVNWRTIYDWKADDRFVAWFNDECRRHFLHLTPLVHRVLAKYALAGSPEHIKLYMQWAGIRAGSDDQPSRPSTAVFINVPRPKPIEAVEALALPEPGAAIDVAPVQATPSPTSLDSQEL